MQRAFDRLSVIAVMIEGPQLRITADTAAYRRSPAVLTRGLPGREPFAELVDQRAFEVFGDILRTGEPATVRGFRMQLERSSAGASSSSSISTPACGRRAWTTGRSARPSASAALLRPVLDHWLPHRVRGHVLICMLANT